MSDEENAMSDELRDTLTRRADLADEHRLDVEDMLAAVHEVNVRHARQRRNLRAGGAGVAVVAAVAAAVVAVGPGAETPTARPAAGPAGGGATRPSTSATLRWTPRTSVDPTGATAAARNSLTARVNGSGHTLVKIAPAPAKAEVSIGLVPDGWVYLGNQVAVTVYAPKSQTGSPIGDFEGKIVVDVHERLTPDGPNALTVARRPARYSASGDGYQTVSVVVNTTTEVDVQVAPQAGLTRAQVLRVAATIDLRGTAEKTHG
jgi:hypothetical protein